MSLAQELRHTGGEYRFVGYKAKIGISVVLRALEDLEPVVTGMVEAGANEVGAISFQTSQLTDFRKRVRRLAIEAARE